MATGWRAGIGYATAAALGLALFAGLGTWQLQRGLDKRARLAQQDVALAQARATPLREALSTAPTQAAIQRVAGRGRYLPPLLLLDSQQREGRVGVRVYAVAQPIDAAPALLVDLGWVAWSPQRTLPELRLPAGERELAGLLVPWPGAGLRLAPNPWPASAAPSVLLNRLDRDDVQQALRIELSARVLRLAPELEDGYARDLELLPNTLPPERHFGYAAQWYALAATVLAVYLILTRRARRKANA
jgi:surfeit locus 1 family protein